MMKPIEPLAAPLVVPTPSTPVKRDDEGLRQTAEGVEQSAASTNAQMSRARDFNAAQLEEAINKRIVRLLGTDLRLRVEADEGTGKYVYKSVDKFTGEVKRQWPSEDVLRMLAFFRELDGLLFDEEA